ncbi:MAG TPA: transglutaminase domain-containing protein [Alphaproteobacteria bacterium]|nr:transglutaminase domain-containing protein [Alphaproteobacteria bacterium]
MNSRETSAVASAPDAEALRPACFVDSAHPAVAAFAARVAGGEPDPVRRAALLYYAVRDEILYDPYVDYGDVESYRASSVLARGRGYCVGKAALLAAAARAAGLPARLAFADVRNHLSTPRLRELVGTDLFIYHGIAELWLGGRWVKATPTFNLSLCEKFHIRPLDFDGHNDAILHPYDRDGRRHMEYVRDRGAFADVPVETIMPAMRAAYPRLFARNRAGGDFAREAEAAAEPGESSAPSTKAPATSD